MFKESNANTVTAWQFFIFLAVIAIASLILVQFFFLGKDIEDTRSKNTKLNIAEILAKQQKNRIEAVSLRDSDNYNFDRAAENLSLSSADVPTNNVNTDSLSSDPEFRNVSSFVRSANLIGVIKNDQYSVAIIRMDNDMEPQVYSKGDMLSNSIVVKEIFDDNIILQSKKNNKVQLSMKMSGVPLISSDQESYNRLNLPRSAMKQ